uniref:Anaphase-promoting complex subunit 11 RING-H2 finger domain-containing protein n=1 Tax=Ditylenchus dipsaci TaxID=166011 RepID=A0A915DDZ2_9BILA
MKINRLTIVGEWRWIDGKGDNCGICRAPFEACCVDCKYQEMSVHWYWGFANIRSTCIALLNGHRYHHNKHRYALVQTGMEVC